MFKYIERLKASPESYRRKFTLTVAVVVTGLIFTGWILYMTSGSFSSGVSDDGENGSTTPLAAIKDMTSQAVSSAKQLLATLTEFKSIFTAASSSPADSSADYSSPDYSASGSSENSGGN